MATIPLTAISRADKTVTALEAAAWAYWGVPASALSARQAAELAATLPSPQSHNPGTRTERFRAHARRLERRAATEHYPRG